MHIKNKSILCLLAIITMMAIFFLATSNNKLKEVQRSIQKADGSIEHAQIKIKSAQEAAIILQQELSVIEEKNKKLSDKHQKVMIEQSQITAANDSILNTINMKRSELLTRKDEILAELKARKLVAND